MTTLTFEQTQRYRKLFRKIGRDRQRPDRLQARAEMKEYVDFKSRGMGWVTLHVTGMDCDGGYIDHEHVVRATVTHVERFIDRTHEYAEGPCSIRIVCASNDDIEWAIKCEEMDRELVSDPA